MERLLQQKLHSPAERGFSFLIGSRSLAEALKLYEDKPKYQRLIIHFEPGEDPDDAYSTIPYEKGSNFLLHLGKYYVIPVSSHVDPFITQSEHWEVWTYSSPISETMYGHSWASLCKCSKIIYAFPGLMMFGQYNRTVEIASILLLRTQRR
jgi:hypothetical protein